MRLTEYSKNLLLIYILKGVPMDKKKEIRIFLAKIIFYFVIILILLYLYSYSHTGGAHFIYNEF
ncbi:teichoic acid D-Ala incorporation-associated protein DltX [Lactococcus cremoris]